MLTSVEPRGVAPVLFAVHAVHTFMLQVSLIVLRKTSAIYARPAECGTASWSLV